MLIKSFTGIFIVVTFVCTRVVGLALRQSHIPMNSMPEIYCGKKL
jgi:hypothetical protein